MVRSVDDLPDGDEPIPSDGRTARAVKTRRAIVDALLELIEEGDLQPTATRIAARAGTSLRLIFHHFGDLESLFRAAAIRQSERLAAFAEPIDPDLPLEDRIATLVERRGAMLEWITPVRRAEMLQEPYSEELRAARADLVGRGDREVSVVFDPELAAMDPAVRVVTEPALQAALGWGLWNDLREAGHAPAQATAIVDRLVRSLLGVEA